MMGVFYLIFGVFLDRGTENFAGFLLCGVTAWNWFNRTVNNASGSILAGRGLMLQVDIPKYFFPLEVVLRDAFKHLFVVCLLLTFLAFYPTPVSVTWLALPILIVVQGVLVLSVSTLSAAIVPFIPDVKFVIQSLLMLMFFGSGVFYDIDDVAGEYRDILYLNPMAGLIKSYRSVLIYETWPDWNYVILVLSFSAVLLLLAFNIVRRFDHIYPRICQ